MSVCRISYNNGWSVSLPVLRCAAVADEGFCLWFTGLSGAGKSTIANIVVDELRARGCRVELLDGDEVREHLSAGLGFSKQDRDTNIRRIGWVAKVLARNGVIAVTAAISPYRSLRDEMRAEIGNFVEVHVATPLEACEARDVKGLYAKARAGEIPEFTGVSDPYEPPLSPEVRLDTDGKTPQQSAAELLTFLETQGMMRR
jgi:adenylylsulfate kinase